MQRGVCTLTSTSYMTASFNSSRRFWSGAGAIGGNASAYLRCFIIVSGTNGVSPYIIRTTLPQIGGICKELFSWVYVQNVYTYVHRIERDEF